MPHGLRCASVLLGAVLLITLAACNPSSPSQGGAAQQQGTTSMVGAGSTFIYPIMTRWVGDFQKAHSKVQINYQSIGSGGGIQQLRQGVVDFGASDAALGDEELKTMPPIIQIPESAGPVCITYNLEKTTQLKLSGPTLAAIFLGKIKNWRDPAIVKDNPGPDSRLPDEPIIVAHRSDGSGTTDIFTTYLAAVSPEWGQQVGKGISVKWPTGLGAKGSEGVTGIVKQTPGAIGYVEFSYAEQNKLPVAYILNASGNWIQPNSASSTAAIAAFTDQLAKDVRTPVVNPPTSAPQAYPITGLTYLLVPKDGSDPNKREALKNFISYIITQGQDLADALGYAKLPPMIQQLDQTLLSAMQANGKAIAATPASH